MPKDHFSCITVLPIGPRSVPAFSLDTIDSIVIYASSTKIIILDDTVHGLGNEFARLRSAVDVIRCANDGTYSTAGRLYKNVSRAIEHALDTYDFELLLRIDDDSLVIGKGYEAEAIRHFDSNPRLGLLGSYKTTCMGKVRDFSSPAALLREEISPLGNALDPARCRILRQLVVLAKANGYTDGENCLGAACFFRRTALAEMKARGFLGRDELASSRLCDDHLLSLITMASGYAIGDFATPGLPLGLAWQGLPASPAELVAMNKKIVHSVRSFGSMDEREIRAAFHRFLSAP